ncbi:Helicase, C-terminal [Penicillium italicum]|uniref:Helicase, C-terminal n=1 Tax=Penicillium italicum TaxID=40296 RepID=A0A0A2KJW1_PENIT|nr:Helicase, C-terminal [Penicillium italicum]
MQSSNRRETRTNRAPEIGQSHFKVSDCHLTLGPHERIKCMSQNRIYPAAQSSGSDQSTSVGLNSPRIKKEFPNENDQCIKTWGRSNQLTIKQATNIKQEPGIKVEPHDFKNAQRVQGCLVIDLTEEDDDLPTQKRPMPRAKLMMAIQQHHKVVTKSIESFEHPVESLFVQDDDSSRSISSNTSDPFLELGEDDISGFNKYQRQFQSLKSPSIKQQIEFEKRREEELQRRIKVRNDKIYDLTSPRESEEETEGENVSSPTLEEQPQSKDAQPEDSQPKEQKPADLKNTVRVKRPVTRVSKASIQKAKEIGFAQLISKEGARKRGMGNEPEPETEQASDTRRNRKKNRRPPTLLSKEEIRSIFANDGGRKKAKDPLPPGFVSTEKNKRKAFREMLASIPVAEHAEARADVSILNEATQTFNPSARSDGQGKWKVRGLKASLMVNQCKRETSSSKPNGGLLCDVMGFGKTLSALACIVNRKLPSEPEGPTLIVAPRNLIDTWMSQIRIHCELGVAGSVIAHCSGARVVTDNLVHDLKQRGIVLTTYTEISSSYPDLKLPPGLKTDAAIEEWWNREYDETAGVFHQIHWHRIILDEAHIIRNRMTRTSIAVRSLSGNFKWALTGTPLHNSVDELYALFAFIGVPNSHPYDVFMHNFCDGTDLAKQRLINTLRAVIHRKTHESRHMGRPLIELKKFSLKEVKVDFYPVEKQIYTAIAEKFAEKVNATDKKKQRKCILTMILKLQMFASHPLTAEDYLKRVCNFDNSLVTKLKGWVKDETSPGSPSPSSKIAKCCLAGKYQTGMPSAPLRSQTESENLRPRPPGNCAKLVSKFEDKIKKLFKEGAYYESDHRTWFCPGCDGLPARAIITDCQHLYCEDCFDALADEEGGNDGVARLCRKCKTPIKKAAFYGIYDDFDTPPLEDAESSSGPDGKKKRPATPETSTERESQPRKRRKGRDSGHAFSEWLLADGNLIPVDDESEYESQDGTEDENPDEGDVPCEEEVDKEQDWIAEFGRSMPGAKFDAITTQVKKWFDEDDTAKIVIFTQYVNSTRILKYMCEENDWRFSQITGRMANRSREIHLNSFQNDDETKIMIASIKTGGLGLDFSVANKCILVDLWWNEAVQDQAFYRLWRLGQQREVECIVLMVKWSIDDWMEKTQKRKAKEISEVMSQNVLMDRSTLKELLEMFGTVTDDSKHGFRVYLTSKNTPKDASNRRKATSRAVSAGNTARSAPPKKRS